MADVYKRLLFVMFALALGVGGGWLYRYISAYVDKIRVMGSM